MKSLSVMIKPASSLCNLRCKYCFYANVSDLREVKSFGVMKKEVYTKVIENIFKDLEAGDNLTIAFQGGEPTVAGIEFFDGFIEEVDRVKKGVKVNYALQTNATLIDEKWANLFKKHNFLIGVSLDGYKEINDTNRVYADGSGTYDAIMKAVALFDEVGVEYNLLMTLTSLMARHPSKIYSFIKKNGFKYIQFTPCLSDFGKDSVYGLNPKGFYSFYKEIFPLWLEDYKKGNYISIKLFDDLINMFGGNGIGACGLTGRCARQIVVEADGSTYPCDFYMMDEYKTGSLLDNSILEIMTSDKQRQFINRESDLHLCRSCIYFRACGGGCKRMREHVQYRIEDDHCYYRDFMDFVYNDMMKIVRGIY